LAIKKPSRIGIFPDAVLTIESEAEAEAETVVILEEMDDGLVDDGVVVLRLVDGVVVVVLVVVFTMSWKKVLPGASSPGVPVAVGKVCPSTPPPPP
jgi:hypothetical protein